MELMRHTCKGKYNLTTVNIFRSHNPEMYKYKHRQEEIGDL